MLVPLAPCVSISPGLRPGSSPGPDRADGTNAPLISAIGTGAPLPAVCVRPTGKKRESPSPHRCGLGLCLDHRVGSGSALLRLYLLRLRQRLTRRVAAIAFIDHALLALVQR